MFISRKDESSAKLIIAKLFSLDGVTQDVANTDIVGDYSDTGLGATEFYVEVPENEIWEVARINVFMEVTGRLSASGYGAGGTLTNGIRLFTYRDGVKIYEQEGANIIKGNSEWNILAGVDTKVNTWGSGNDTLSVRFSFNKIGRYILNPGEKLGIEVNDDFSSRDIVSHKINVQGEIRTLL